MKINKTWLKGKDNNQSIIDSIDITPPTSIYTFFKKIQYTICSAVCELVDNSTSSFIENKSDIDFIPQIDILFDKLNDSLIISDNGFGVSKENFWKLVTLQSLDQQQKNKKNSKNEFGLGLKQSGFWLADDILIITREPGNSFFVNININLEECRNSKNKIQPIRCNDLQEWTKYSRFNHGTVIILSKNLKKFNSTTLQTLLRELPFIYKNDINDLKLQIRLSSKDKDKYISHHNINKNKECNSLEEVEWLLPEPIILAKDEAGEVIFSNINDTFISNDKKYNVNGFIGILEKGSREKAGLILFRRNRVVGDNSISYRPKQLFGTSGSFEYQRIYGELNLDDFPINQQKTGFDWDDELEDDFKNFLYEKMNDNNGLNLVKVAKERRGGQNNDLEGKTMDIASITSDIKHIMIKTLPESNVDVFKKNENSFILKLKDLYNEEIEILVEFITANSNDIDFFDIINIDKNIFKVKIDMQHPLFNDIRENIDAFVSMLGILFGYLAYSEIQYQKNNKKMIETNQMRYDFNMLMEKYKKEIK